MEYMAPFFRYAYFFMLDTPFIVICLYLPLRNKLKWARLAISMLIMIATVVPWVLRNQAVFGEALLLPTKGGRNLWEYNNQIFTLEKMNPGLWLQQQYEQLSFDSLRISALEKANRPERAGGIDLLYQNLAQKNFPTLRAKEVLEFPQFTTETEVERDRMLNHNVKKFILQNPRIYVQLCGLRLYQLFRVTPRHLGGPLATAAAWCSIGWILPASFLGLFLSFKQWRRRSVLYALIFYTVATHTLTASGIPHRVPTDPYFILFAAFFIAKMLKLYAVEGEVSNAISNR